MQIDILRGILSIRRMDKVPNAQNREKCRVTKGVDERIDESFHWLFSHTERMGHDWIPKRVYVG